MSGALDEHVQRILGSEVRALLEELGLIDLRLREIAGRDDEESRLEYIVLSAYRRYLIEDLESLAEFATERGYEPIAARRPEAVTQACTG